MKKLLTILVIMTLLGVVTPVQVQAQCGNLKHSHGDDYTHRHRSCVGDGHKHGLSFWQKHRDKITTGGGALAGAAIGGLAGGKKGAAIGAITSMGCGAMFCNLNMTGRSFIR